MLKCYYTTRCIVFIIADRHRKYYSIQMQVQVANRSEPYTKMDTVVVWRATLRNRHQSPTSPIRS